MRPTHEHSRGQTTLLFVLALVPLLGMAGLAVDVGRMYTERRRAQAAADLAASAGAQEVSRPGAHSTFEDVANTYASRNGFMAAQGDTITLNNPPTSGPLAGNPDAYEVIIRRPVSTTLLKILGRTTSTVEGRSVAVVQKSGIGIVVLESSKNDAFKMNKKSRIDLQWGTIYVNSTGTSAIHVQDESSLTVAIPGQVRGGFKIDGHANLSPPPKTGVDPIPDPLASLPVPPCSLPVRNGTAAHPQKLQIDHHDTKTLCPGIYFGGLEIQDKSTVTLDTCGLPPDQAVFVFSEEGLHVHNDTTLIGHGITIYNAAKKFCVETKTDCGDLKFEDKADTDLSPPTAGAYEGILLFQDRTCNKHLELSSRALSGMEGELYLAKAEVKVKGKKKGGAGVLKTSFVVGKLSFGNFVGTDDGTPDDMDPSVSGDPAFDVNAKTGGSGRRVHIAE